MAKIKATALKVEKRITEVEDKTLGILNFDFDNLYPQRVDNITNDSGTAQACLKTFIKFIMGNGATDNDFYKARVNEDNLTVDKFIRKICNSKGRFDSVAIHINFNGLKQHVTATPIPWEYCRLTSPDGVHAGKIAVYDDWGKTKRKTFKKELIQYIDLYDLSKVDEQVEAAEGWENYKGQVYLWSVNGENEYSLAPYDAVLEDMQTEAQLKRFKHSTSAKNFLASYIMRVGKDESPEAAQNAEVFDDNLRQFQGGDGAGTILVLEEENGAENIKLEKIEIQNYDRLYEYTETSAQEAIRKQFFIPAVLLLETSTGFSSDELLNAKTYYNDITAGDRLVIEEILKDIFSNWSFPICPSNDYSLIPIPSTKPIDAIYLPYYTKNEIRVKNGDAAADDAKSDTTLLAVTLGVGGMQALTAILSSLDLSDEQKKGSMKVLFGLSDEQANQMLGITTEPTTLNR
jgi:hypothetical protein